MLRLQNPMFYLSRIIVTTIARRILPASLVTIITTLITSVYTLFQSLGFLETMRIL